MTKYQSISFLFPGQGSQSIGMGKELIAAYPILKDVLQEGDERLGRHLSKTMREGPEEELTKTATSQPAIYLLSLAYSRLLKSLFPHLKNKFAAGLSLGEYSALASAGMIDDWKGLELVAERGRLMGEACDQNPGTMAAILGLSQLDIEKMVKEANLPHDLWAANFNSPGQTVVSGTTRGIEVGAKLARERGAKKVIPLTVHGAFHSGLMRSAQQKLQDKIEAAAFVMTDVKVVMNASASFPQHADEVKKLLIAQVTEAVRWQESIEKLENEGVDLYIEVGSGKTLSSLNKRIGVKAPTFNLETPADIELLAKELNV